jgi:hypothetical protein
VGASQGHGENPLAGYLSGPQATAVLFIVIGAVELRLAIGGESMEHTAANVSLIALAVWLACRVWQR